MMYIRLRLDSYYDTAAQIDRMVRRTMPVEIDRGVINQLKPQMSPQAWSVYCSLLLYESVKLETKTPCLEFIYDSEFKGNMTKAEVNKALDELRSFYVNGEPLVELLGPNEELGDIPEGIKNYFSDPLRVERAVSIIRDKINGRGTAEVTE